MKPAKVDSLSSGGSAEPRHAGKPTTSKHPRQGRFVELDVGLEEFQSWSRAKRRRHYHNLLRRPAANSAKEPQLKKKGEKANGRFWHYCQAVRWFLDPVG